MVLTAYSGCYPYPVSDVPSLYNISYLTVQQCVEWCRGDSKQYSFVSGQDCWCLNHTDVEWNSPLPAANCSTPCSGNYLQACGLNGTLGSVYRLGKTFIFCLLNMSLNKLPNL